jgi:hypothetical protein
MNQLTPWYPAETPEKQLERLKQACEEDLVPDQQEAARPDIPPPKQDSFAESLHSDEFIPEEIEEA